MNTPAIYKNMTHPAPVAVVVVETLPSGWAWVRLTDGQYKWVKATSLHRPQEATND